MRFFRRRNKEIEQLPKTKPKMEEGCEIKAKRDASGRIIGMKRTGKCTKEDIMAFVRENNLDQIEVGE